MILKNKSPLKRTYVLNLEILNQVLISASAGLLFVSDSTLEVISVQMRNGLFLLFQLKATQVQS